MKSSTTVVSAFAFIAGVALAMFVKFLMDNGLFYSENPSDKRDEDGIKLACGIISAPDHFEERMAIRETWLHNQNSADRRYRGWFIIGNKSCDVHPNKRVDEYGCERVNYSQQENYENVKVITGEHNKPREESPTTIPHQRRFKQLYFKVMHPIKVKQLGILSQILTSHNDTVTVSITSRVSEEIWVSATFSSKDPGISDGIYNYQTVQEVMLPQGFEGCLTVDGSFDKDEYNNYRTFFNSLGGVLALQRPRMTSLSTEDIFMMSLTASVIDVGSWSRKNDENVKADEEWREYQNSVREKIHSESRKYDDILLVDVVDVYRNLPKKLLHFHKWLYASYKVDFVLKTDDDCFVDLDKITSTLEREGNGLSERSIWWGSFREQWLVETYGKWMELDYSADVYPKFACGSGNVISSPIHEWIAGSGEHLHAYQGEDVSMGIWLSALAPEYLNDKKWHCSGECAENMYTMPQLSPGELRRLWSNKQRCQSPCSCSG